MKINLSRIFYLELKLQDIDWYNSNTISALLVIMDLQLEK